MNDAKQLELMVWILSGLLGFIITIIVLIFTSIAKNLSSKLTELITGQNTTNVSIAHMVEQIKTLFSDKLETERRLNDLGDRVRDIELNCKEKNRC